MDFPINLVIAFYQTFSANNDGASVLSGITRVAKLELLHLRLSAHDIFQHGFSYSDEFCFTATVVIVHFKFDLLMLFEVVGHLKTFLEVWVQVIIFSLSVSYLVPFGLFSFLD